MKSMYPCKSQLEDELSASRRDFLGRVARWGAAVSGVGVLGGCASMSASNSTEPAKPDSFTAVRPFSDTGKLGGIPAGWQPYIMRRDRAQTSYITSMLDDRKVLHAHADGSSSGLFCPVNIDPLRTPWLSWQWRVDAIHDEATVMDDDVEDTPARIVVAFDGDLSRLPLRERLFFEQVELFTGNRLPYATLTYLWDGQLPVGQVLPYARSKRIQYQVVESGGRRLGHWLNYERNVVNDFKSVFGEMPGRITSIGVMTDSDDLKNQVEAWYGDISVQANRKKA